MSLWINESKKYFICSNLRIFKILYESQKNRDIIFIFDIQYFLFKA
jgi:hypothetical protein